MVIKVKILLLLYTLLFNLHCFYISKQPIPILFVNQQFRLSISHNGGDSINFKLVSGPNFVSVQKKGQVVFFPKTEGSYELVIQSINSTSNTDLITLSYILVVLNKQKLIQKPLWILSQDEYYTKVNDAFLTLSVEDFDFRNRIMTNQNIRLKLLANNSFGTVQWFYEGLPQTMSGNRQTGVVSGYVENQGNFIIKCTALDSNFKIAQIFLFLKFYQAPQSLQHDTYSQYSWKNALLIQQKKQNAGLIESELKSALERKNILKQSRLQKVNLFKSNSTLKQQMITNLSLLALKNQARNNDYNNQLNELKRVQDDGTQQKYQLDQAKSILTIKNSEHLSKLDQNSKAKSTQLSKANQLKQTKENFQTVKTSISSLQDSIYKDDTEIRDIQYNISRHNLTYQTYQKQEIRTREILEIRKNIEFQYLIKKTQTDNKVRRNEDYVFLAQTNYDFAYSEYKKQSLQYLEYMIQSKNLAQKIQMTIKEYDEMNRTMNRLKLNYAIAEGKVETLKVAKQQLNRLSDLAFANATKDVSSDLNQTYLIEEAAKSQVKEFPFAGCKRIGNYVWAGSGKIKILGRNTITLGSEETVYFGKCTQIKSRLPNLSTLANDQWIQFNGYFWDGAIQAVSITILKPN